MSPVLPLKQRHTAILILTLLVWGVFGQALTFDFVRWDDNMYVFVNDHVRQGLSWKTIAWAFTNRDVGLWHPLTWLSHLLDVSLWGMQAGGHHAASVLLHWGSALLLFLLLEKITGDVWRSLLCASLFAIHPLRAESVAWVAERKDVLFVFWTLACLYAYVAWTRTGKHSLLALAAFLNLLALLSKPTAVVTPALLLLLDYWPLGRLTFTVSSFRQALRDKWLFAIPAMLVAGITLYPADPLHADASHGSYLLWQRLYLASYSYGIYLWKTVWPIDLAFFHRIEWETLSLWPAILSAQLVCLLLWLAWNTRQKYPCLLFGMLWYCIAVLPVSGIVQIASYSHADRYAYLPHIGLFAAFAWSIPARSGNPRRQVIAAALLVTSLAIVAFWQTTFWRDSGRLFSRAIVIDPANYVARLSLAEWYVFRQQPPEALKNARATYEIASKWTSASAYVRGMALVYAGDAELMLGRIDSAHEYWRRANLEAPNQWEPYARLGYVALKRGDASTAEKLLLQAVSLFDRDVDVWNNLGGAFQRRGNIDGAIKAWQRALQLHPAERSARLNLARQYLLLGRHDEAAQHFRIILQIAPDDPYARDALRQMGRMP